MVDLFFVLSGFVMARTYGDTFSRSFSWAAYWNFLQARVARVYPLYAIVTLASFVFTLVLSLDYPIRPAAALLTNLLLIQNLGSSVLCSSCSEKLILPGWSISTEAAVYLAFPILATIALFRSRASAATVVLLSASALVGIAHLPFGWVHALDRRGPLDISGGRTLWPLLRCLAGFSIGLVAWRLQAWRQMRPNKLWGAPQWAAELALAVLLAVLWCVPGADIFIVALFPALILHLCTDRSPLARALGSRLPYRAGEWSYAIYLLHWPMLMVMPFVLPLMKSAHVPHAWTATLVLMAAWTIVLSAAAYRYLERPARRELRAMFNRRRLSIAMEPSAP